MRTDAELYSDELELIGDLEDAIAQVREGSIHQLELALRNVTRMANTVIAAWIEESNQS